MHNGGVSKESPNEKKEAYGNQQNRVSIPNNEGPASLELDNENRIEPVGVESPPMGSTFTAKPNDYESQRS